MTRFYYIIIITCSHATVWYFSLFPSHCRLLSRKYFECIKREQRIQRLIARANANTYRYRYHFDFLLARSSHFYISFFSLLHTCHYSVTTAVTQRHYVFFLSHAMEEEQTRSSSRAKSRLVGYYIIPVRRGSMRRQSFEGLWKGRWRAKGNSCRACLLSVL